MEYLIRYSVQGFYERLTALQTGTNNSGKKAATNRQKTKFQENTFVREIQKLYEEAQDEKGKVRHPKMEYLQNVVTAHFASEEEQGRRENTRVMVFCQFRECVSEIVELLNELNGIDATSFVGQASDGKGGKGMKQKEQEQVVQDFKSGKFNVLVATSIGEEGLDIGEVDLIVNYEAVKNSVRMLQRIGRTGRKRNGRVVVLMSEGSEENNWQHSKDNHRTIQDDLINGSHLELFDDVERLVPEDITSVAVLEDVDQPPFEPSMIRAPARQKKIPRPGRNSDPLRNVPKNGLKGFVKVSEMKKKRGRESLREGDSSDSQSPAALLSSSSEEEEQAVPSKGQAQQSTDDSSNDEHLERGFVFTAKKTEPPKFVATMIPPASNRKTGRLGTRRMAVLPPLRSSQSRGSASSKVEHNLLSSSPPFAIEAEKEQQRSVDSPLRTSRINVQKNMDQSDEQSATTQLSKQIASTPSSPVKRSRRARPHPLVAKLAAELGDSDDDDDDDDDDLKIQEEKRFDKSSEEDRNVEGGKGAASFDSPAVSKRKRTKFVRQKAAIRIPSSSPLPSMGPPTRISRKGDVMKEEKDDDEEINLSKVIKSKARKRRIIGGSPTSRRLFQYEADRSTDEEVHGERDEDDDGQDTDEADSSDREHVGDFAPTQAPRGYKQDAIYLQSLHSQANLTPFRQKARGIVPGYQMGIDSEQVRRYVQDTPRRHGDGDVLEEEENDQYEKDSFVCSDEEFVFESEPQSSQL